MIVLTIFSTLAVFAASSLFAQHHSQIEYIEPVNLIGNSNVVDVGRDPVRDDFREEWIFYDDNQAAGLIAGGDQYEDGYWSKVTFTPERPFLLHGIRILPLNQGPNDNAVFNARVYSLDQESGDLDELLAEFEINNVPEFANDAFIEIVIADGDELEFDAEEDFAIMYYSPGGPYQAGEEGAGWWCLTDGANNANRSFWVTAESEEGVNAEIEDPADEHDDWRRNGGDLLLRANGEYIEEGWVLNVPDDFESIQEAIDAAEDGNIILVAPGEYVENINFAGKAITVLGNPDDPSEVIINGDAQSCVVCFEDEEDDNSILQGFTITNGLQNWGGGIDCQENTSPMLVDLIITENEARDGGGGIHCSQNSTPLILRVIISDNSSPEGRGGGLSIVRNANPVIRETKFIGNIGSDGGALYCVESQFELDHVLMASNEADSGSAIFCVESNALILSNVTIINNTTNRDDGGGIEIHHPNDDIIAIISNSILYNNGPFEIALTPRENDDGLVILYCDVLEGEDGIDVRDGIVDWQDGNIDEDPLFVDPDNGNYNLSDDSPCIDTGDPESPEDPDGSRADMGAFYYQGPIEIEITIPLSIGWNFISAPIVPTNPEMIAIWEDIVDRDHLIIIKDFTGNFYAPGFNFNDMPDWDVGQAYKTRLSDGEELIIAGFQANENLPIPLIEGWNMAAYLPEAEVEAVAAFANIDGVLILVKNGDGEFYIVEHGFSNMPDLSQTNGYQVKVSEDIELVWNVPERVASVLPESERMADPVHFIKPTTTGNNMSLLLVGQPNMSGKEVAVISGSGIIVGAGRFDRLGRAGIAVWGDDNTTIQKDGLEDGESFKLKVWDDDLNREISLNISEFNNSDKFVYTTDSFVKGNVSVEDFIPAEYFLAKAYPNPFNSMTRIDFGLPVAAEISIKVYDLAGRTVTTLMSGEEVAGRHSVVWNAFDNATGVYLLQMKASDFTAVQKLAFVK